jgi:hypothetical protein
VSSNRDFSVACCEISAWKAKYGFKIFHAKDFKARVGDFDGWSDGKCYDLTIELNNAAFGSLADDAAISRCQERPLWRTHLR